MLKMDENYESLMFWKKRHIKDTLKVISHARKEGRIGRGKLKEKNLSMNGNGNQCQFQDVKSVFLHWLSHTSWQCRWDKAKI